MDYVIVYSGPEPPSGGVSRPPLAVIAPHWTQFEGVTSTPPSTGSYTWAGHMRAHSSATSGGTSLRMTMWFGWSSRVLLPDAKTDDSLSNVSLPSAAGYRDARSLETSSCSASRSVRSGPAG